MAMPMPPQVEMSLQQLSQGLDAVEKRTVDLLTEPWGIIESGMIKLLGGAFRADDRAHQMLALGLAGVFGHRLNKEFQAFWFPTREAPEGGNIGFPEALIMLSPFGAVVDALRRSALASLDDVTKDIRTSLGKAKFSVAASAKPVRLQPEDYARLFDPGFVQLLAIDNAKLAETLKVTPGRLMIDVREAVSRATRLPPEAKQQIEQQLVSGLQRFEPSASLSGQVTRAPRVAELMTFLFCAKQPTGCAPEEFWHDVVFPLLFVGTPSSFPPLDEEELAAAKQGVHPLFLLLEVVPFQFKSPEDEGVLGAFPVSSVNLIDASFAGVEPQRTIEVKLDAVAEALKHFDAAKTKDLLTRFAEHLKTQVGSVEVKGQAEAQQMFEAALTLLGDVKRLSQVGDVKFVLRHLTEAEAASEPALGVVREAASGPRIILAG
jgi:hypothetical protein